MMKNQGSAVSKSVLKVMLGGSVSLAANLLSQVVIAAYFGAGAEMDAFLTALVIPAYLLFVLVNGLSFVVVPAFIHEDAAGRSEDAWGLVGTFFWVTTLGLGGLALLVAVFADPILSITAPSLPPEKMHTAAQILSITIFTLPLGGLRLLAEGVQNARNRFFWPAAATAAGSLGNVAVLLLFYPSLGSLALAWGNLLSAALTAAVPLLPVLKHRWKKIIPLRDARVRELFQLMLPLVLFGLVIQSWQVIERFFASWLPDGDLSYIGYASKLSSLLVAILASGIASAILPAMSRALASQGETGLTRQIEFGFHLTLATALPAVAYLSAAATPLLSLLFERGEFTRAVTLSVSRVVWLVLLGDVLFRMLNNINSRAFYSVKDTRTFSIVNSFMILPYAFLAWFLSRNLGYIGLAMAFPLQAAGTFIITFLLVTRRFPELQVKAVARQFGIYAGLAVVVYLAVYLFTNAFSAVLHPIFVLLITAAFSGLLYLGTVLLLDPIITQAFLDLLLPRIREKRRKNAPPAPQPVNAPSPKP